MRKILINSTVVLAVMVFSFYASSNAISQMKKPNMTTISGTMIDLTCASKGYAMSHKWYNAKHNDHKTPKGPKQACAVMCLQGGQPAALFSGNKITAVFSCNPKATLSKYAQKNVELQGYWAGDGKEVKAFFPVKIRTKGSASWSDVDCATMH